MNKLRFVSIVLFAAGLILFGGYMARNAAADDGHDPVLELDNEMIEVSVRDDQSALLRGVHASDEEDGDLTDSVIVESLSRFNKNGRRIVTYAVVDSDDRVAHASRELAYSDFTYPQFSLDKPLVFEKGTTNITSGIHAWDCLEGDLSSDVRVVAYNGIDVSNVGKYSAELMVTSAAGAVSVLPVTIEIYNAAYLSVTPFLELTKYVVYVPRGAHFDASEYLKSVTVKGVRYAVVKDKEKDAPAEKADVLGYKDIDIQSNVDPDVPGNYQVQYTFRDAENAAGSATLYVVVTEGGSE